MTDGRTDGQTDGRTDRGDCNIPIAFLKKRGDKYKHTLYLRHYTSFNHIARRPNICQPACKSVKSLLLNRRYEEVLFI